MKYKVVIIITIALIALGAWLMFHKGSGGEKPSYVTPSTPVLTPSPGLSEQDRSLVGQLSRDLASKYTTLTRPDDQAYLDSIKPYLAGGLYIQIEAQNKEQASRIPFFYPYQSVAAASEVTSVSGVSVSTTTTVRTTNQSTGEQHEQVVDINWTKIGDRWTATKINVTQTQLNSEEQ